MYRKSSGFPGALAARIGTVDDLSLHEGVFKPRVSSCFVYALAMDLG